MILCKKTQAEQVAAPNVAKYAETDTCIADIAFIFGKHLHKIKVLHNLRCLLPIQATTKKKSFHVVCILLCGYWINEYNIVNSNLLYLIYRSKNNSHRSFHLKIPHWYLKISFQICTRAVPFSMLSKAFHSFVNNSVFCYSWGKVTICSLLFFPFFLLITEFFHTSPAYPR